MDPVAAAIGHAVADAIGARIHTLPITPEKVLAAIDASNATAVASRRSSPSKDRSVRQAPAKVEAKP
jgi:hypothetical protein